jgi:hypothetical protein
MKSLKLARLVPALAVNGNIPKAGQLRAPFETAYARHLQDIEGEIALFNIEKLVAQIEHECCWPTSQQNPLYFGQANANDLSYCVGLMNRISMMIAAPELACVFRPTENLQFSQFFPASWQTLQNEYYEFQ